MLVFRATRSLGYQGVERCTKVQPQMVYRLENSIEEESNMPVRRPQPKAPLQTMKRPFPFVRTRLFITPVHSKTHTLTMGLGRFQQ
jgi:hypothetical protein